MDKSTPKPICSVCRGLTARAYIPGTFDYGEEPPTIATLEASSKQGCWGCKYSMELFSRDLMSNDGICVAIWNIDAEPKSISTATRVVSIHSFPDVPCPFPGIRARYPISGDTGSDKALASVRGWLEDCAKEHRECPGEDANTPLPTRVLKIDGPKQVTLHVSGSREVAPYLCLSHCWGKSPMIRTISSNIEKHQAIIGWDNLPKTFQHAIDFTHRLGFTYLWIDSLCIIQDSVSDWRQESARMAEVYQGSSLTLCATLSSDSSGGCYANAAPEHLSLSLTLTDSESKSFKIYTRQLLEHIDFNHFDDPTRLPLLSRGWALQERLLSPRTVNFTANELIWSCSENLYCECSGSALDHLTRPFDEPHRWAGQSVEEVYSAWNRVVETFSRTDLSHPKDIFPALQGLAKKVPPTMGQYLAGLWRENLATGLAWHATDPDRHLRPKEWRAPTWSWASVTGPLIPYPNSYINIVTEVKTMPLIKVIEAKTTPKGTDPTGELSSGELLIRGRGVKMHVVHDSGSGGIGTFAGRYGKSSLSLLRRNETLLRPNDAICTEWDYAIAASGPDHVPDGSEVIILKLLEEVYTSKWIKSRFPVGSFWLVLQSSKHVPEAFERIGLVFARSDESSALLLQVEKGYRDSPEVEMRII